MVRPPAPRIEALGYVLGTHGRVRVTVAKLSASIAPTKMKTQKKEEMHKGLT
jgi:hypothetical protein